MEHQAVVPEDCRIVFRVRASAATVLTTFLTSHHERRGGPQIMRVLRNNRMTGRSPLYGMRRWRRKAKAQLRAEPLCQLCDAVGKITAAAVADHVVPHAGDPEKFWFGKLQSLCKVCHNSIKAVEERTGYLKGAGADGMPLDPNHPWNDPKH